MRSREAVELILDELWNVADGFTGETPDTDKRLLLTKLGNAIGRLWSAIEKGDPYRVALATMAMNRRYENVFGWLQAAQDGELVDRLLREDEDLAGLAEARLKRESHIQKRHKAIRKAVLQRMEEHPPDSLTYAQERVAENHRDHRG